MILVKLFQTIGNFTILQERSGGTIGIDQMRKSLPGFSSSIQQAKALLALPRHSAINQIPSRFCFHNLSNLNVQPIVGHPGIQGHKLQLFKMLPVMETDQGRDWIIVCTILIVILEALSHDMMETQSHSQAADRI
jgi:hypothetical protein